VKRPIVYRCYRCRELQTGKPALTLSHQWKLCPDCYAESQGVKRAS